MAQDDRGHGHALGPDRPHVVLAQLLDHAGPGDAGERGHRQGAERDRRHDQRAPGVGARRREDAEGHRAQQDQEDAAPEGGHALADEHDRHQQPLHERPPPDAGDDPDRQPDAERDRQRPGGQQQRVGQPRGDDAGDRDPLDERGAEVEARQPRQVVGVLDGERAVEAELMAEERDVLPGGALGH